MYFILFFYTGFAYLALFNFHGTFLPERLSGNNPPKVVITKPVKLNWNSIVPFSIRVNDPEDGNSEYDEISTKEVLLMVNFLPNPSDAKKYLDQGLDKIPEPLMQMSKSTCLICHASKSILIGPSFDLIANRYQRNPGQVDALAQKVITGSQGTWGELIMPPHPDVKIEEMRKIIGWILDNGANPNQSFYVGTEGAFQTREKPKEQGGVYILTGGYTDHGIKIVPNSNMQGKHTLVLTPF